jgi:hypothetical protein
MPVLQRYFPTKESAQIPWCNNYKEKIGLHGPVCGESAAAIAQAVADMTFYVWLIGTWAPAVAGDAEEATAYKKLMARGGVPGASPVPPPVATTFPSPPAPAPVLPGILTRLFDQVARLKASPGYKANPDAIGQDLDIIGAVDATEHLFPEFKLKLQPGPSSQWVRIDFTKFGHKGVWIESRRNGGAWEFLAVDSEKPYNDERPLLSPTAAETREYRMRFWDDGPNGDWSPVQKVAVGP